MALFSVLSVPSRALVLQYSFSGTFSSSDFSSILVGDSFSDMVTIDYSAPAVNSAGVDFTFAVTFVGGMTGGSVILGNGTSWGTGQNSPYMESDAQTDPFFLFPIILTPTSLIIDGFEINDVNVQIPVGNAFNMGTGGTMSHYFPNTGELPDLVGGWFVINHRDGSGGIIAEAYGDITSASVTVIPESSSCALAFGVLALVAMCIRRRP
jgi:hypothetical protein